MRRFINLMLVGAFLGLALSLSLPARAEITTDFKVVLIGQAQEIKGRLFDFQRAVHQDLANNLIQAEYWLKRAYLEVKAAGEPLTQTAAITAKIQSAVHYKDLALGAIQSGGSVLQAKIDLQEVITETGMLISEAQTAPQKITPAEATELQSGYIEPMLEDLVYKDQLLLYIDYLLEDVNKRLSDAQAAVAEGSRRKAKMDLIMAESKLRQSITRVWWIKWNLMYLTHRVYGFIAAVTGAPVLGLGLTQAPAPPVIEGVKLLPSAGALKFTARGRRIAALRVEVFGLDGRRIFTSPFAAGNTLEWSPMNSQGEPLANGVYLYVVTARGWDGSIVRSEVRKLVILR